MIDNQALMQHGFLLQNGAPSVLHDFEEAYPYLKWGVAGRKKRSQRYWTERENRKMCIEEISKAMDIASARHWYAMSAPSLAETPGGHSLLSYYKGSLFRGLKDLYPEIAWEKKREFAARSHWEKEENRRLYLDECGVRWRFSVMGDWYALRSTKFVLQGGEVLLKKYAHLFQMISENYKEFSWLEVERKVVTRAFWKNGRTRQQVSERVRSYYQLKDQEEWIRVSNNQVKDVCGRYVPRSVFRDVMGNVYPETEWREQDMRRRNKKSRQLWLLKALGELFPGEVILEDYHFKVPESIATGSGDLLRFVELDFYVPSRKMGLEFQGQQHYLNISCSGFDDLSKQRCRDVKKQWICEKMGLKLVAIPFWWNDTTQMLSQLIQWSGTNELNP